MPSMDQQFVFLEAAAKAGVKYVFPTEFSSDTSEPEVLKAVPIAQLKAAICKRAGELGLKWYALITNQWLDFSVKIGLYDIDIQNKTATIYDDSAKFNTTTLSTSALALARLVSLPKATLDEYANKYIFVSSGFVSQPEIFDLVKKATETGDSDWNITHSTYEKRLKRGNDRLAKGDLLGMADLAYGNAMKPGMYGDYERTKGLDNDLLGLPNEDLVLALKKIL